MPFDAPTASATPPKAVFAVDEPTQEFRPLRPRPPIKITKPAPLRAAEPELDGYARTTTTTCRCVARPSA
jgi:hypothetical protein